jgi:transcriptional regulator with XRE-family HTH domain
MNIKKLVGLNLRHMREKKGWSQDRLSEETGMHRTYISGIERGVRNPTIEVIHRLSTALHVEPASLLSRAAYRERQL